MVSKFANALACLLIFGSVRATTATLPGGFSPENQGLAPTSGCIDSAFVVVLPVNCFGLRTGEIRVITVLGGTAPFHFSLDGQSFTTNPVFDHLWAGTYMLSIRDSLGCFFDHNFTVPQPPELVVTLVADKTSVKAGEAISIEAKIEPSSVEIVAANWRPPSLFPVQDSLHQIFKLADNESIAVEVRSAAGCVARAHLDFQVEKTDVFIPNAFMPGSNRNAFFTVYSGEGVAVVRSLRVFDRWTKPVFENFDFPPNDPLAGWNGLERGQKLMPGVYTWAAEVEYLDGSRELFAGDVTLLRDVE